jgi:hypothetical protein
MKPVVIALKTVQKYTIGKGAKASEGTKTTFSAWGTAVDAAANVVVTTLNGRLEAKLDSKTTRTYVVQDDLPHIASAEDFQAEELRSKKRAALKDIKPEHRTLLALPEPDAPAEEIDKWNAPALSLKTPPAKGKGKVDAPAAPAPASA